MNKNNVLLIFVKAPTLGQVKTRLQPEITPQESLLLYRAMVEDLIAQFKGVLYCDVKVFFLPSGAKAEMQQWLGDYFEYLPQTGSNLGDRMYLASMQMFRLNYKKVIIVGSDIPTLGKSMVSKAFSNLDNYDLILGPSTDGGYYLIGLKESHQELFKDINWGTNIVLQQTLLKSRNNNLSVFQLDTMSDIDTYSDVIQLWHNLKNSKQTGDSLPRIYNVLSKLFNDVAKFKISEIPNFQCKY